MHAISTGLSRFPDAPVRALLQSGRPRAVGFRMLVHWLKDPRVFALVAAGYQRRWRLPLIETVRTSARRTAGDRVPAELRRQAPGGGPR
jgi:hypothetical protein